MFEFSAEQIYEIAYKLERLPEMSKKMLARRVLPSRVEACTCSICEVEFVYHNANKKTCSEKCSDKYEEKINNV